MKGFLATTLVTLAAASKEIDMTYANVDVEHQSMLQQNAVIGQEHVDLVVDDPYTLSGIYNVHGSDECMHAIGHDGTYEYIRLVPEAGYADDTNCSGDYIESTTMYKGKHLYVNFEKERFMGWNPTSNQWGTTSTSYMKQILNGEIAEPWGAFMFGTGEGDKPVTMEGFSIEFETDMDMEPEWRCLMRPLLVQAVGYVEEAELSIESKALLEEKKMLVEVHERLVVEAEDRKQESLCIEIIEKAMAALEECELQVLRNYVEIADTYPQSWLQLLNEKVECVDKFSRATASCNHLWTDQWERYYGEWTPTPHVDPIVITVDPVPVIVNPVVAPVVAPVGPPAVTNDNYFLCALEHQNNDCQCGKGGYVFYGTESSIHEGQYAYMQVEFQSLSCANKNFGDPLPGVVKQCYCVNGTKKKASDCEAHQTFNDLYSQCN